MCNAREEKLDAVNGAAYHVIIVKLAAELCVLKEKASKKGGDDMRKQIIPALAAALMLLAACAAPEAVPSDTPAPTPTLSPIETPEAEPSAAPWPPGTGTETQTVLSAPIEWVEESEMTGGELMPAYIDEGGELLGPDGFDVDGENVYILNTADNSAYVYADGELERQISLDVTGLYAIRMAVEDGNVYIFGVEQDTRMPAFAAVYADGTAESLPFMEQLSSEAVVSITAENGKLRVEAGGRFWSFDLADPEASVRSTEEYMIADGTTWSSRMTGSGTVVSDSMALDITLPDGRELSIPFKPSSPGIWLGGLRLLRCGGGEYDVYVVEIAQDEEYLIHTAEYILRVDEQGTPLGVYAGEEADQFYSARSDGGALYTMGVDGTSVTVKRAPDVYTTAWADYVSPLADITLLEE